MRIAVDPNVVTQTDGRLRRQMQLDDGIRTSLSMPEVSLDVSVPGSVLRSRTHG